MKRSRSSDSSADSSGTESSDLGVASGSKSHTTSNRRRQHQPSNQRGSVSSGNVGVTYQAPAAVTQKHLTALLQCMVCHLDSGNLRSQPSLVAPVTFPCGHTSCLKHSLEAAEPDANTPVASSSSSSTAGPASGHQSRSRCCPIDACAKLIEDHKKGKGAPPFSAAQALHAHSSVRYYLPPAFSLSRQWPIMSGDDLRRDIKVNKVLTLVAQDESESGAEPEEVGDNQGANDATGSLQEAAMAKRREEPPGGRSPTASSTFVKCLKEILSCEVCLMLYYEPMTLVCGHTFCARCLQRTLDQNPSCPLCRHEVGPEARARLHLLDLRDRDVPTNKVLLGIILLAFPKEYMDRRLALQQEVTSAHAGPCNLPVYLNQMALPGHTMRVTFDEGRYRLMLRRIMRTSDPRFGMMLVPRYALHGENNNGYGTMMQILSIQLLPDNRSICEVQAVGRFRVVQTRAVDGYIVAKVQTVEDIEAVGSEISSSPSSSVDTSPVAGSSSLPAPSSSSHSLRHVPPSVTLSPPSPPRPPSPGPEASSSSRQVRPSSPSVLSTRQASSSTILISPPSPSQPPSSPDSDDLSNMLSVCTKFVEQLRSDAAPWVVQRLNNSYGDEPPKEDLVAWCWWLASLLPIDDHEKAKLLPIRSPELRLRLICHWIQKLNDQWWYANGCVIC
ncbi:hypothetical protein FRB93_011696 [Tulasnella sp. JGI-2019a]|nr:hypothetical protein FRB93_011696 [Tulasnella sp. JGI-2019a]